MPERIYKNRLGFKCGKLCAICLQPVSLDWMGRLTCFSSEHGGHVKASDGTTYAAYNPRDLKAPENSDFANEAAILGGMGG